METIFLKTKPQRKSIIFTSVLVAVVLLSAFLTFGSMRLWAEGIAYYTNDDANWSGYNLEGDFSVEIDLSDLESNVGKILYSDEKHKIYVSNLQNVDTQYIIYFRSVGDYSSKGASLISGLQHIKEQGSYATEMSAKMITEYNGKSYSSEEAGATGLNYKDGDEFGFYMFPAEAYNSKEKSTVKLTVSNLYKNIWERK